MFSFLFRLVTTGALVLVAAPVFAQSAPSPAAYTGPRYPGGPDSLRALVGRSTRQAEPGLTGRMLVEFELQPDGKPQQFSMVRPPDPLRRPLVEATAKALDYLEAHMSAWQPAPHNADDRNTGQNPKVVLTFNFGVPTANLPYEYADETPTFTALTDLLKSRNRPYFNANPAALAKLQNSPQGLSGQMNMLVRYPVEALRNRQQGTVYAYFEVAENGAIEHREILGTAGAALDKEVLRVVQSIPAATTPAQLQGRPVRVRYAVPVTFKIK